MPGTCTVCQHPDREAIDAGLVEGVGLRATARQFGTSKDALARHRSHISASLLAVRQERDSNAGENLLARVETLIRRAEGFLAVAERTGQVTQGLAAIRELRGLLELLGKASGELRETPSMTINVLGSGEWSAIRTALFGALASHPDARQAVAGALLRLGDGS